MEPSKAKQARNPRTLTKPPINGFAVVLSQVIILWELSNAYSYICSMLFIFVENYYNYDSKMRCSYYTLTCIELIISWEAT